MYAVSRYYITDFAVYEAFTGELFCLRMEWDMFTPGIAEKTELLKPLTDFQKKEIRELRRLEQELTASFPGCELQIISLTREEVFLSSKAPGSEIAKLSKQEFSQLSEQQLAELAQSFSSRPALCAGSLQGVDYLDFLRFLVRFRHFSLENIISLYRYNPRATDLRSFAEWSSRNFVIPQEKRRYSALLPVHFEISLFRRGDALIPLEHAVSTERALIAEKKLPLLKKEYDALLEVWDEFDICRIRSPFVRVCNPQLFFETLSGLAKVQGFEIVKNPDICESYYQKKTKTIHLPQTGDETMYAKWICREYAAALVEETAAFSDKQRSDLAAESLAWMLSYRCGFDVPSEYLSHYYKQTQGEQILSELSIYLFNAFCYIQEAIEKTVFSDTQLAQAVKENLLANAQKYKNRRSAAL